VTGAPRVTTAATVTTQARTTRIRMASAPFLLHVTPYFPTILEGDD
jgi:hypothetical protein